MKNEEKQKEKEKEINNNQNNLDLNDLFQRTYEFDIFKYVSRGLIKSQQNYENQLNELKLQNLKTKKQILSLKKEIELLKGNNPNYISTENNNLKIQEITNEENIEEKEVESSNESMVKMTNAFINELVNENKKRVNQKNDINNLNIDKLSNDMQNIKNKLEEIDNKFNQYKLTLNKEITESNNEIRKNISENILKIKEQSKKELTELNEDINQKINLLNTTTKTLNEKTTENEKLMNKSNSINNTFLVKLDLMNSKFNEYASKSDFEKYKLSLFNQLENENRQRKIDISSIKNSINALKIELAEITNDTSVQDTIMALKQKQDSAYILIEKIQEYQRMSKEKEKKIFFVDASKLIDIDKFNEYKNSQNKIIDKIKRENIDLLRELSKVKEVDLNNKTNFKDLKNLEDNILIKFENLLEQIKEKFVQKKYLEKYFKIYEYNINQSLEEFKSELKPGKRWLLAKKPLGHLCASCETYLGELSKYNENSKNISKASEEKKNLKLSVGFSKVINLINKDENNKCGSFSLDLSNVNNGRNNSLIKIKKNFIKDNTAINNLNNTSKINKINSENNKSFENDENENDALKALLPKIKKKMIKKNMSESQRLLKHSIKSLDNKKEFKDSGDNTNYIIMVSAEQRKKGTIELGPKITKILKKMNKNKNEDIPKSN